jgi:transposase-like protein
MRLELIDRQRWTPKRKATLLAMIEAGEVAPARLALLGISQEELKSWRRDFSDHGVDGLHVYSLHYHHPNRRRMRMARG